MYKLIVSVFISAFAVLLTNGKAFSFAQGEQDCTKCHTLNAEQAKEVLQPLIPDVKILQVGLGPVNGFWEIGMESGGRKGILYLDFSKKKLVAGNIIDVKTKANYTQESYNKINKVNFSEIPLENSLVMGDKDAKYKIVVFDDPE